MVTSDAVAAMKSMASDPKKRAALAKDSTCIGGLVIVLSNSDSGIVKEALQTLILLCECSDAQETLNNQVGMTDQLCKLMHNGQEKEVSQLAECLAKKLKVAAEKSKVLLRDTSNISSCRNSSAKNQSLQGQKVRTVVLQLKGYQDKSDRDLCARLLLKVKGVISITFDLAKVRCIVRTKSDVKPEMLAASIAKSMTMTAQQVVRNELGEESFICFNSSQHFQHNTSSGGKENEDLPDYLSDDSDSHIVDDKALKRPSEEDKKKSAGWFSAAANFLANSFYW